MALWVLNFRKWVKWVLRRKFLKQTLIISKEKCAGGAGGLAFGKRFLSVWKGSKHLGMEIYAEGGFLIKSR